MKKDITQDDLLLLAYNELSPSRRSYLIKALAADKKLYSKYLEIQDTLSMLNEFSVSPHPTTLQIILEESSSAMEVH